MYVAPATCYTFPMATEPLIAWHAPEHMYVEKHRDWYWAVGLITIALVVIALLFGQVITSLFILVAAFALTIHAARQPRTIYCEINDRGIIHDTIMYPFVGLESFWIPHDHFPPKIILKSRKTFSPYIVIYIDEIDPEEIRAVLLGYLTETEHHEPMMKHLLEWLGF